jgi:hypothetical protein
MSNPIRRSAETASALIRQVFDISRTTYREPEHIAAEPVTAITLCLNPSGACFANPMNCEHFMMPFIISTGQWRLRNTRSSLRKKPSAPRPLQDRAVPQRRDRHFCAIDLSGL